MNNQEIYDHVRDLLLLRDALADREDRMGATMAQQLAGHLCGVPLAQLTSSVPAEQPEAAAPAEQLEDDDPFGDVDAEEPTTLPVEEDDIPF